MRRWWPTWLGVPFDAIRFVQGDTDAVAFGRGTYAARSSLVGGCALKLAADAIIEKARAMAAYPDGGGASRCRSSRTAMFAIAGTDRAMSLADVARAFVSPGRAAAAVRTRPRGERHAGPPIRRTIPMAATSARSRSIPTTGAVRLDRYAVVDDIGRVVNPMICEGQVHGALAQGIGQALLEEVVYDRRTGQLLTGSFADYAMPRAATCRRSRSSSTKSPRRPIRWASRASARRRRSRRRQPSPTR